jgi:hypothetical protein
MPVIVASIGANVVKLFQNRKTNTTPTENYGPIVGLWLFFRILLFRQETWQRLFGNSDFQSEIVGHKRLIRLQQYAFQ